MTRRVVIAANWKMHKLRDEALVWRDVVTTALPDLHGAGADAALQVVVAAPATLIATLTAVPHAAFDVFAQNAHEETHGAYTGEVSVAQLADAGARGVILGHSERRALFGESDDVLHAKVRAVLAAGLQPMLCVGETLEQRDADQAQRVVETQLLSVVDGLGKDIVDAGFTVAYEPVWAIGTGRTATPEIAQTMHAAIRAQLGSLLGERAADRVPILYGGSVKPDNVTELLTEPDIDGALVGGAALDAASFAVLVEAGRVRAGLTGATDTVSTGALS